MAIPSYDDVVSALDRIRATPSWDLQHPERGFVLSRLLAGVDRSCARLAAYRLAGETPPLGYYDDVLASLQGAIESIVAERRRDHGDAPECLHPAADNAGFAARAIASATAPRRRG